MNYTEDTNKLIKKIYAVIDLELWDAQSINLALDMIDEMYWNGVNSQTLDWLYDELKRLSGSHAREAWQQLILDDLQADPKSIEFDQILDIQADPKSMEFDQQLTLDLQVDPKTIKFADKDNVVPFGHQKAV